MSEAESVKVPVPRVLLAMVLKVIDWVAFDIVNVTLLLDEVAAL